MSKNLLLYNLKELYSAYTSHYPKNKIGFLKFASLCHKWCSLDGPKETHSVCVCTIHQNLKLMLSAIGFDSNTSALTPEHFCNEK